MKLRESEKTDWWNVILKVKKESIEMGIQEADSGKMKPLNTKVCERIVFLKKEKW